MALSEKERAAVDKKIENPQKQVKCPRCGAEIKYTKYDTAILVKCSTDGCIKVGLRGI